MLTAKQNIDLLARAQRTFNLKRLIAWLEGPDKSVLDAGCGSGILSIWAAQAGSRNIMAIDNGDMAMPYAAARANGCEESIAFIQADLNNIDVPTNDRGRFDLLLALVYLNDPRRDEDQVRLARRLSQDFVKAGGDMLPDRIVYTDTPFHGPSRTCRRLRRRLSAKFGI
jgi:ribosomal protein L11 methylase PrmA